MRLELVEPLVVVVVWVFYSLIHRVRLKYVLFETYNYWLYKHNNSLYIVIKILNKSHLSILPYTLIWFACVRAIVRCLLV